MRELGIWGQLVQLPFLNLYSKLLYSAMQLDVFSHLQEKRTAGELAKELDWHEKNTEYLLSALNSLGFLERDGENYWDSQEARRYLVKESPEYLGGFLLFYGLNEGAVPMDVQKLVTEGPGPMEPMEQTLDFSQYADFLRQAQTGYRQQELLRIVRSLPENPGIHKVLDVGCATGLLGLAVIGDEPERTGVLFDQPPMGDLIEKSIEAAGMCGRAEAVTGDFMTDDLGEGYDLILAVSVLCFARGRMEGLLRKFYQALNPEGVLVCISEGVQKDFSGPWDMVLGYLPYCFQGMEMAVMDGEITEAAAKAGFQRIEKKTQQLCSGNQDVIVIRK